MDFKAHLDEKIAEQKAIYDGRDAAKRKAKEITEAKGEINAFKFVAALSERLLETQGIFIPPSVLLAGIRVHDNEQECFTVIIELPQYCNAADTRIPYVELAVARSLLRIEGDARLDWTAVHYTASANMKRTDTHDILAALTFAATGRE